MTDKQLKQQAIANRAEEVYWKMHDELKEVQMYDRPTLDRYQDLVTAAYGSPVNPTQTVTGDIELRNPLDDKVLATVPAKLGEPNITKVVWQEGVEHDDSKSPSGFNAWNQHTNRTDSEHKPTPEVAPAADESNTPETVDEPVQDDKLEAEVVAEEDSGLKEAAETVEAPAEDQKEADVEQAPAPSKPSKG